VPLAGPGEARACVPPVEKKELQPGRRARGARQRRSGLDPPGPCGRSRRAVMWGRPSARRAN